jgi:hypothetical protein
MITHSNVVWMLALLWCDELRWQARAGDDEDLDNNI